MRGNGSRNISTWKLSKMENTFRQMKNNHLAIQLIISKIKKHSFWKEKSIRVLEQRASSPPLSYLHCRTCSRVWPVAAPWPGALLRWFESNCGELKAFGARRTHSSLMSAKGGNAVRWSQSLDGRRSSTAGAKQIWRRLNSSLRKNLFKWMDPECYSANCGCTSAFAANQRIIIKH